MSQGKWLQEHNSLKSRKRCQPVLILSGSQTALEIANGTAVSPIKSKTHRHQISSDSSLIFMFRKMGHLLAFTRNAANHSEKVLLYLNRWSQRLHRSRPLSPALHTIFFTPQFLFHLQICSTIPLFLVESKRNSLDVYSDYLYPD